MWLPADCCRASSRHGSRYTNRHTSTTTGTVGRIAGNCCRAARLHFTSAVLTAKYNGRGSIIDILSGYSLRDCTRTAGLCWLLLCIMLPSACGFALRSADRLSSDYDSLVLDIDQAESELARLLRRTLHAAGVTVLAAGDVPVLSVSNERSIRRPVSINPRARAAQYELRLSVDMTLHHNEEELLPLQTLLVERSYFEDIANIAGNREEVEIITSEMRRDLVERLMRRLQAGIPDQVLR